MIESVGDGALDVPKTSLLNPSNPRSISNVYRRGGACSSHNLSAKSLFPAQHIHLTVGTTIGRPKTSLLHRPQRTVNDRPYNQRLIPSVGTFLAGDGSSLSPSVTPLLRRDPPSLRLLSSVYRTDARDAEISATEGRRKERPERPRRPSDRAYTCHRSAARHHPTVGEAAPRPHPPTTGLPLHGGLDNRYLTHASCSRRKACAVRSS